MSELIIENSQDIVEFTDDMIHLIQSVCDKTLELEECNFDAQISISIVDDEQIRIINNEFRGIDKATDVLSFPMLEYDENGEIIDNEFEYNEDGTIMLGDIVISLQRAVSQADEYGHDINREIAFLCAHSMLHLLGYDHVDNESDEKIMFQKQENILNSLGITR